MNSVIFDAPKSAESYEDIGVGSLDSDSIQKEASAQVLSEILADFGKESETDEAGEKVASEKAAQEEKVKEEDKKEEEKEEEEKEKEEKAKKEGSTAEDLALEKSLEKDAASYYDLGRWMAVDKVAEELNDAGEVDVKTSSVIRLHVAGLADSLIA